MFSFQKNASKNQFYLNRNSTLTCKCGLGWRGGDVSSSAIVNVVPFALHTSKHKSDVKSIPGIKFTNGSRLKVMNLSDTQQFSFFDWNLK